MLHGGTCPNCFGEIPGEDAPTDLGEELKLIERRKVEASMARRARVPVLVLTPVALVAVLISAWYLKPVEVAPLEIGDISIELDLKSFEGNPEAREIAAGSAKGAELARGGAGEKSGVDGRNKAIEAAERPLAPSAVPGAAGALTKPGAIAASEYTPDGARRPVTPGGAPPPPSAEGGLGPTAAASTAGFGDLSARVSRPNALLTDDGDIRMALRDTLARKKGRLMQCYEQSAKTDEELGGAWKVSFTIGKDGAFKNVVVKAVNRPSAPLEACVRDQISSWSLGAQLEKERSLSFPLNFGGE